MCYARTYARMVGRITGKKRCLSWSHYVGRRYQNVMLMSYQQDQQQSCAIAKMIAQCAPYMGALKIFGTPDYAHGYFPQIFNGLLFRLSLWICLQNLKPVASPVPELIGVAKKCPHSVFPKKSYMRWSVPIGPAYILFVYQHVSARNFRLQFWLECNDCNIM